MFQLKRFIIQHLTIIKDFILFFNPIKFVTTQCSLPQLFIIMVHTMIINFNFSIILLHLIIIIINFIKFIINLVSQNFYR